MNELQVKASVFRWARFFYYDLKLKEAPRIRFYSHLKCDGYAHDINLICLQFLFDDGILRNLAHEFRHIYQYQILGDRNIKSRTIHNGVEYKLKEKDYEKYLAQPWEIDARLYETWFYEKYKAFFTFKEDYTYQKKAYQSLVHSARNRRAC